MKHFIYLTLALLMLVPSLSGQSEKENHQTYTYENGMFDTVNEPSKIIASIEQLLKNNKKEKNEILRKVLFEYLSCPPAKDEVLITLFDKYCSSEKKCSKYLDENEYRVFNRKINTKRKVMVGNELPPFQGCDINSEMVDMDTISKPYTILWIWDPDCDHCQEYTPILHDFYYNFSDIYHFEVVAVSVSGDQERWEKFIFDNQLEWINLSYAMGDYNYDLIEYLDLMQTPAVYLLDDQNKILAREFSFDNLETLFKSLNN